MVLLDHGGRHPSEVELMAPPPDLEWLVQHLWILRVLRLHAALRAAWKDDVPWSAVAYLAGYADQAHLTREVRALLGEAPSAWRARGSAVLFKTSPRERR
jgi:AraC-like DNA-binding protein